MQRERYAPLIPQVIRWIGSSALIALLAACGGGDSGEPDARHSQEEKVAMARALQLARTANAAKVRGERAAANQSAQRSN